jgi:hypothetical protein
MDTADNSPAAHYHRMALEMLWLEETAVRNRPPQAA